MRWARRRSVLSARVATWRTAAVVDVDDELMVGGKERPGIRLQTAGVCFGREAQGEMSWATAPRRTPGFVRRATAISGRALTSVRGGGGRRRFDKVADIAGLPLLLNVRREAPRLRLAVLCGGKTVRGGARQRTRDEGLQSAAARPACSLTGLRQKLWSPRPASG